MSFWTWITGEVITATKINTIVNPADKINATNVLGVELPDNDSTAFDVAQSTRKFLEFDTTDGAEYTKIFGGKFFENDVQLTGSTADGFPNTTTTYIWNFDGSADGDQTDVVGSKVLTRAGANALTAANDVLGVSRYNACGADTELTSTDTVFNIANTADTDDFIAGGWFYLPSLPGSGNALMGNTSAATSHGWYFELTATGLLSMYSTGAVAPQTILPAGAGWYHIVGAREVGVAHYLFVNGVLVSTSADTTYGLTQTKFQVSGINHSTNSVCNTGTRFDEIFFRKGVLPTNLSDVIRNIYARSAKKFAVKDQSANVKIEGQTGVAIYKSLATTETQASDIPEASKISFIIPENGLYQLQAQAMMQTAAAGGNGQIHIKVGSSTYASAVGIASSYVTVTPAGAYFNENISRIYWCKAEDTIHLGVAIAGGAGNEALIGDNDWVGATSLSAIKIA